MLWSDMQYNLELCLFLVLKGFACVFLTRATCMRVIILELIVNIVGIDVYVVLFNVFLTIHAYSMYSITSVLCIFIEVSFSLFQK